MLWRKIFDRNPLFQVFCDKLATKEYISKTIPETKTPKTLWIGNKASDLPVDFFSKNVVLKSNHGSDFNYFIKCGNIDKAKLTTITNQWTNKVYGKRFYEWGYFDVTTKLFIEEMLDTVNPNGLLDINVRCVDGVAILTSIIINNKTDNMKYSYFDAKGNRIKFDDYNPIELPDNFTLPSCFDKIIKTAEKLSKGIDYARYDFMWGGKDIYIGEITVYPSAGLTKASVNGATGFDETINEYWNLNKSWFLTSEQTGWKKIYSEMLRPTL